MFAPHTRSTSSRLTHLFAAVLVAIWLGGCAGDAGGDFGLSEAAKHNGQAFDAGATDGSISNASSSGADAGASSGASSSGGSWYGADAAASTDTGGSWGGASDAGSWGGGWGGSSSSGSSSGGPTAPGAKDQSLGFKPGGAQDIGYFRALVKAGKIPKPGDMKIEGWINEHDTKLPKADPKRTVHLHAMAGVLQGPDDKHPQVVMQMGLNSGKTLDEVDAKVGLVVVIDRSGSMNGSKMVHVKEGLTALLDKLPQNTTLAVVSFSSGVTVNWPAKAWDPKNDKAKLLNVIKSINPGGGTNMYAGLDKGIQIAKNLGSDNTFRRVILLGDGKPSVGITSPSKIIELAEKATDDKVSVSSVGVGLYFNPKLMTAIAEEGDGTAWFLQNSAHAKHVFINDLQTMLLPVAEKLWLKFKLAKGWMVDEIYGFDWLQKEEDVTILGPAKPSSNKPNPPKDEDAGSTANPDAGDPPKKKDPPSALPTLFASNKNGMIMVRLLSPSTIKLENVANLLLANVEYGYTLAKSGKKETFTTPVTVPGVAAVPDGSLTYFASPIVRRSFVLLQAGRALQSAVKLHADGKTKDAVSRLIGARALIAIQKKHIPANFDLDPGLDDADKLLAALMALLNSKP